MTDKPPVEPPVLVEDELAVECSNSNCDSHTTVATEIDGRSGEPGPDDWTLTLTTDDGVLVVHEAYCPEHRLGTAIDDLAETQREFTSSFVQTYKQVDEMAPN